MKYLNIPNISHKVGRLCLGLSLILFAQTALSGIHFTLQGSFSDNNLGLRIQNNRSASTSIAVDLGTYFRIGLTHRQSMNQLEGYVVDQETQNYFFSREQTLMVANSVDLTIILYYGRLLVPYIQLGTVKKFYDISTINEYNPRTNQISTPMVPNGGVGVGVRINRNFSVKLSYSVSPGIKEHYPSLKKEGVLDSFTSVGVSYNI